MRPCVSRRKSERIKSQLLPHLAQITTFLLSGACGGRKGLLERGLGRNEEQIEEREREGRGREMERDIKHVKKSVISCKVCWQGENKMRKAHFNLQSFGSKTKLTDHSALTTCPKLQFTFHFLKYTQHGFRQILFFLSSYFHINILCFSDRKTGISFSVYIFVVYLCRSLCQHCIRWESFCVVH